jgi:Leucine-rich repeat (LRR) protein
MKQLLLICAVVALVGCHAGNKGAEEAKLAAKAKAIAEARAAAEAKAGAWVSDPNDPNNVKVEKAIRKSLKKPTGELTKADLGKVTVLVFYNKQLTNVKGLGKLTQLERLQLQRNILTDVKGLEKLTKLWMLDLKGNQLTDVKGLEKLTQLKQLNLGDNPDLTKAQIDQLQKALPNCGIYSNPKK